MIKSTFLTYRTMAACQVQAWFSLRPHTREQRHIKTIVKQEERLMRVRMRLNQVPLVLKTSSLDAQPVSNTLPVSPENRDNVEPIPPPDAEPPMLYHDTFNQIHNPSDFTSEKTLTICCAGCGAQLHCGTPGTHGFLPNSEIDKIKTSGRGVFRRRKKSGFNTPTKLCLRCQLTCQHETALKQSLLPAEYGDLIFKELDGLENSTIILIADLLNLPHSLVPLRLSNPSAHKIVLIGNKIDQLPIDGPNFYSRCRRALLDAFIKTSGLTEDCVSHVSLVSALNGHGIQQLLDYLLSRRFDAFAGPVYLVGTTNTGKSSVFNRLLLSDFCKAEAKESIHRATVSFWPGTTAGLLKFPLSRMSFVKRAIREQSKYTQQHSFRNSIRDPNPELYGYMAVRAEDPCVSLAMSNLDSRVERSRDSFQDLNTMPTYRLRHQQKRGGSEDDISAMVVDDSDMGLEQVFEKELGLPAIIERRQGANSDTGDRLLVDGTIDPRQYNPIAWCHDTPGLKSPDQTLNFLSPGQLVEYMNLTEGKKSAFHLPEKRFVLPRTFVLQPGLTMLLGQLGRLDVLESSGPVYLTTHTRLPVHIVETDAVEWYTEQYAFFLGPGLFAHRNAASAPPTLPEMASVEMDPITTPQDLEASVADVILSGAGWISVAGVKEQDAATIEDDVGAIRLRAWTPGGAGISLRAPALLPYAIRRRGSRLLYLREFSGPDRNSRYAEHVAS